jgi:hypothetical protein
LNKLLKATVVVLILATVVQAGAMGYMFGYEQGISSQEITILKLQRELHPELIYDPVLYFHPLRNTLFSTGSILALCWAIVVSLILRREPTKTKESI